MIILILESSYTQVLVLKHKSFTIVDISAPGVKLPQPLSFQRPIEKHQLFAESKDLQPFTYTSLA